MSTAVARSVAIVVGVVAAGYGACKVLKHVTRSDENKELEARQDKARDAVGPGLDDVFSAELDADTSTIMLEARLVTTDAALGAGYDNADACAKGFSEAFEEALGPNVIKVSTFSVRGEHKDLTLDVNAKIAPSGQDFQLANSRTPYHGITLDGDIKLGERSLHVKAEPGGDLSIEYTRFPLETKSGASEVEVAWGILAGTCKEAGYQFLEHFTKWQRPQAAAPKDPVAECERGFHCIEAGDELAPHDPGKAQKLYAEACQHDDADACERLATITLGYPDKTDKALAHVTLEMACGRDQASACTGAMHVALIPLEPGNPAAEFQRNEALVFGLRGCDLGDRSACEDAAPFLKGTPFAEAAGVLATGNPIATKRMGTVFAVRWGQWTKFDRGQPTLWVTRRPTGLPAGAIVKEFGPSTLPRGITPPDGVETVYAVALHGGNGGADNACDRCNPSGGGDSIYSMRSFDCVCAISPH